MSIWMNRRRFLRASSSAIAVGAMPSIGSRASAQSTSELRVMVGGGDWGKANLAAHVKPFEAETGIKVTPVTDQVTRAQLELMVNTRNYTIDVVDTNQGAALALAQKGMLEDIDYSIYNKEDLDGLKDFAKPFGVGSIVFSWAIVCNTNKFPAGKPRPTTWAEFWNVSKFPGVRLLQSGEGGSEGPWEEALLADGVAADKLYPMDIDRVFASLDKIKPHVRKWWLTGSEIQQLMRDKVADVMASYDGRAQVLIDQGAPLEINHHQNKLTWNHWVIPKGTPNARNAQRFIEFATRANQQAAFSQLFSYGPCNANAFKHIPDAVARKLASYPEYMKSSVQMNARWYAEVGSDGVTNVDRLIQRWNAWVLK